MEGQASSNATAGALRRVAAMERRLAQNASALIEAQEKLKAADLEAAVRHGVLEEKMTEQMDLIVTLRRQLEERAIVEEELRAELAEHEKGPGRGNFTDAAAALAAMQQEVGIRLGNTNG